ncbi:hypothetical protein CCR90_17720 [Rhodovulum sulfidophilum]|uniref:hypothetical protein n=1 Tax=Rhodovulum sulfidophilum TaxID=35806 RepID=UPI003B96EA8E|nr:hypothetical protein [Rhodovulum sulfidophilum]
MGRAGTASAFIALAYRRFDIITMCRRYSPKLAEEIADLLVWLTTAKKTWGFGHRVARKPDRIAETNRYPRMEVSDRRGPGNDLRDRFPEEEHRADL